jgi:hypothetical protein
LLSDINSFYRKTILIQFQYCIEFQVLNNVSIDGQIGCGRQTVRQKNDCYYRKSDIKFVEIFLPFNHFITHSMITKEVLNQWLYLFLCPKHRIICLCGGLDTESSIRTPTRSGSRGAIFRTQ